MVGQILFFAGLFGAGTANDAFVVAFRMSRIPFVIFLVKERSQPPLILSFLTTTRTNLVNKRGD
jgi:hypothetical protein